MKRIKIVIITIFIFLMTGCSVTYDLNINEDLSVDEKVTAKENTISMQTKTNLTGENAVNYLYDMYSLEGMDFNSYERKGYTYGVTNRSFDSLKKYSDNFYSDIFYNMKVTEKNGKIELYSSQSSPLSKTGSKSLIYDEVDLNITVPFKVISNNADFVKGDTYTWNIRNKNLKTIRLKFDTKNKQNSANIKFGKSILSIKYSYILLGVFGAIIVAVVVIVIINNKKNNSL